MLKLKNREVDVEEFALEYIKHDALVKHPYRGNKYKRVVGYHALAQRFGLAAWQARTLEKLFRNYVYNKMESFVRDGLRDLGELPEELSWLALVEESFHLLPKLLQEYGEGAAASSWSEAVLRALCTQAMLRGTLGDSAMFGVVRRTLHLAATDYDLESAWETAKRLSLEYLSMCSRAGDAEGEALPEWQARIADVVLLYTDLDACRLLAEEGEQSFAEAEALSVLWQLVQRHRLEERAPGGPSRVRAQRWSRALRHYRAGRRAASLVLLQRRWHELKLRTRYKLVNYWRTTTRCHSGGAPARASTPACSDPPRELHIAILRRYPHIATSPLPSWRELVDKGLIITRALDDDDMNVEVDTDNSQTTRKRTATEYIPKNDIECQPPKNKLTKPDPAYEIRIKDTYSSNVPCTVKREAPDTDTSDFNSVLTNIKTEVEDDIENDPYLEIYNGGSVVKKETSLGLDELPTNGSDPNAYKIEIDICIKQEPVETISKCPILFSDEENDTCEDVSDEDETFDTKLLLNPCVKLSRIDESALRHAATAPYGLAHPDTHVKVEVEDVDYEPGRIKCEVNSDNELDTYASDGDAVPAPAPSVRLQFCAVRKHQRLSKAQQSLTDAHAHAHAHRLPHTLPHNNKLYILRKVDRCPLSITEVVAPSATEVPEADTPTVRQLELLLNELTDVAMVNHVLRRAAGPCCAARKHADISDARARMGLPPLPRHAHAAGAPCACCCARRPRADLDRELRALHRDLAALAAPSAPSAPPQIAKSMMDQNNKLDDKLIRKRKLAYARLKKHRKKKREEAQQQKLRTQTDLKCDNDNEQIQQNKLERQRELARERAKKYRDEKRLSIIRNIENAFDDTQIPGPSDGDPELTIKDQRITTHNSQIPGTSANMNIPIVMKDYSRRTSNVIQANERSLILLSDEENCEIYIDDNSAPLQVQAHASVALTSQFNRSSTYSSYARHSYAHMEFHRQFTINSFGHACKICERLWFKNDLKNLNDQCIKFVKTFLPNVDENSIVVCSTCQTSIQKKSIPSMAVYNGFKYPVIPSNLLNCPLDFISERLISPRIPFMQIRRLRNIYGQYGIYGQIINVPIEVNTMVNSLPRNISDDHCIYIHIKRKKIYKSSFLHGLINKRSIKEWLLYLVNTPLYRTYDITIDEQFFDNLHDNIVDSDKHDENDRNDFFENIPIEECLLAQQQTVMWNDDLYLNIAPGENNVPISLSFNAEELSFPSIYLGQFRQFREGVKVTPFMMATSELRRSDRRGVTPQHLLYMAMKIMRMRVRDSLRVAFKHVGKNSNFTKEQTQSEDYIHGCIESNLAFFRSIPNSTWYWSENKKDLFAMIRQLGKPTVYFTISANEIGWSGLLQLLYKLNKHESITKAAVEKLHFMVKSTLINEDAVTCALYFNKLVNVIMNILQSKKCTPFPKFRVLHYFKRIEFQHRGSPNAHILAWLDNAPKDALDEDYNKAIELIDALISVSASEASGNIKLQTHKHTFTCFKKNTSSGAQKCRFEAPFMPCKKTMILCPMKDTAEGFINYQKRYAQIRVSLENEDFVDIHDFYSRNGINSDDEYYNIIRAGITRPKVFVKRDPNEKWHNPFNPFILNIVKSNTDFQFITEEYSCAAYVVEYINKTNRGMSHLRRKIIETMNEHPEFDIIEITKKISENILNHTEITSQEAAWYLLREPICKSSLSIVYIPTVWPTERQRIRNTIEELSNLEDSCMDIWKEKWFDKYEKRPDHLESVTLAQFVSKYTKNKNGKFIERSEPRIIRYRNYDMSSDFQEYKREMVTLHLPFRSEEVEILAEMKFISIYDDNENIILQRKKEFESNINYDKTIQICRQLCRE